MHWHEMPELDGIEKWSREWFAKRDELGGYFRLNSWGMGAYRNYMHERGMLDLKAKSADYPEHQAFGVTDEEYQQYPENESEMSAEYRAWRAAVTQWLSSTVGGNGLMPAFKFGSNDGWIVTPDEITKSLTALEDYERRQREQHGADWVDPIKATELEEGESVSYWDKWIRYLYCARAHGGVEVH